MALKYEIVIYWSEDDAAFIAEVPELPGCMADGASKAKALAAVERVAKQWVETAKAIGRPIPAPRGKLMYA
jgi:predicted RNase H-like HicB family nuclease